MNQLNYLNYSIIMINESLLSMFHQTVTKTSNNCVVFGLILELGKFSGLYHSLRICQGRKKEVKCS